MHEYPAEILIVLFDAVIQLFYLRLLQKPQNVLLQLAATLTRNDLHERDPFLDSFRDDTIKFRLDRQVITKYAVHVQFYLTHLISL